MLISWSGYGVTIVLQKKEGKAWKQTSNTIEMHAKNTLICPLKRAERSKNEEKNQYCNIVMFNLYWYTCL